MKVPTVSKFCGFFDLTTGGLFLGYIGAVTNAGCALALFYELVADTDEFEEEVYRVTNEVQPFEIVVETAVGHKPRSRRELPVWVIVFVAMLWIGLLIMCFIFSVWFIEGINNRNPQKVRYFMVIIALGTCSAFIKGVLSLSFWWIIFGMANVYFFICVYSLYQLLQYEDVDQAKIYINSIKQIHDQMESYQGDCEEGGGYKTTEFNEP